MPINITNFEIQIALNNILGTKLIVDGQIGPKTKAALLQYAVNKRMVGFNYDAIVASLAKDYLNKTETQPIVAPIASGTALGQEIIKCAKQYIGLVEIKPNTVWDDLKTSGKDIRADKLVTWLKKSGHEDGYSYCMSFCEACVRESLENLKITDQYKWLLDSINPSVMSSFNALNKLGKITKDPTPGSIGFMQNSNKETGHAFIVENKSSGTLFTIEGNTSSNGATVELDRSGDLITSKSRQFSLAPSRGLWIRGFWNPV